MSQSNTGQAQAAETLTQETKTFIRQVRTKTRRKYTPEDKIRIVLEGFRREVTVSDLCRREGIKPGVFYAWTKEFMEAGKERLTRDTVRDATRQEIEHLKRENYDLKQLVADLSLEVHRFKKTAIPTLDEGHRHMRRPGEVERHNPGGTDPMGENGGSSPNCRCPGAPITGGGPVNCKGSKNALPPLPGSPGTGLAHQRRPQYWRRPGSLQSGVAGNWPLGSQTT